MKKKFNTMKSFILILSWFLFLEKAKSQAPLGQLTGSFSIELDWSIHPRFVPERFDITATTVNGYSRTGHRYLDSYVHPSGYKATFKLLVSNQSLVRGPLSYKWEFTGLRKEDGSLNPFTLTVNTDKKVLYAGPSQSVDTERDAFAISMLPYRGTYKVKITAFEGPLSRTEGKEIKSIERVFEIKDHLIVVMGDSFASGEGNPDAAGDYNVILKDSEAVWLEPLAHRSFKGALSRIAAKIEADDPHSCVTFINVATSGAKTSNGILFQQHEDWQAKGQAEEVKDYIKGRKVDMILLSIGLNDFGKVEGMSELIKTAANPLPPEFLQSNQYRFAKDIVKNIEFRYDEVYDKLSNSLNCRNVVLFQMPVQFMRDANGNLTDGCGSLLAMENEDILKLEDLGNQLIAKQRQICAKYQWLYVDGIRDLFKNHGYCAENQSWFIYINSSLENQGDVNGAIHPNELGHKKIAELAFPAIKRKLEEISVPTRSGSTTQLLSENINKQ